MNADLLWFSSKALGAVNTGYKKFNFTLLEKVHRLSFKYLSSSDCDVLERVTQVEVSAWVVA
ncbi:hypothetical protein QJS10_CPA05g02499 [Acorus calamus]|uniref:Uncharacterized protein n=1 Tax=Acorus calamus TaxID=4465 RepID=A0AAV9EW78_ACOCL|nr:hypothetical protein QJS10_CPA05g02499 [Acorus calamus]